MVAIQTGMGTSQGYSSGKFVATDSNAAIPKQTAKPVADYLARVSDIRVLQGGENAALPGFRKVEQPLIDAEKANGRSVFAVCVGQTEMGWGGAAFGRINEPVSLTHVLPINNSLDANAVAMAGLSLNYSDFQFISIPNAAAGELSGIVTQHGFTKK